MNNVYCWCEETRPLSGFNTLNHYLHIFFWGLPTNFPNINAKCTFVGELMLELGIINVTQKPSHIEFWGPSNTFLTSMLHVHQRVFILSFILLMTMGKGPNLKHIHIRFWSIPSSKVHPHDICDVDIVKKYKVVHKKYQDWHRQNPDSSVLSHLWNRMRDIK